MKNIAIIGAGTMGNGIAHCFALSGYSVNLIDLSQDTLDRALGPNASDFNLLKML